MSNLYKSEPNEEFWRLLEQRTSVLPQIQQQLNQQYVSPAAELILRRIERKAQKLADIVKG